LNGSPSRSDCPTNPGFAGVCRFLSLRIRKPVNRSHAAFRPGIAKPLPGYIKHESDKNINDAGTAGMS
jgi:hypothetical protein